MLITPRGTKDILPEDIQYWQHIESISRDIFNRYNYDEIRTPIFESTEVFTGSIGETSEIVQKEMYTFTDKGNRQLTLRPEGTAAIVRAYIQHQLHRQQKEHKLFYIGPMFRYERPQAGRYRQFHQIGAEYFGSDDPMIDAELLTLSYTLFKAFGINDLTLHINSLGDKTDRPAIEALIQKTMGNTINELPKDVQETYAKNPLRLLDSKNKDVIERLKEMPSLIDVLNQKSQDTFKTVCTYLDEAKTPYIIRPTLVRGLDYYTHTVFELISENLGAQNTICGGGRYNNLVKQLNGPDTPACGFAFGIERLITLLKETKKINKPPIVLLFLPIGNQQHRLCNHLINTARQHGYKSEIFYEKTLKKQLKKAGQTNAKWAIIMGEEEAKENKIQLKNLATREQKEIKSTDLLTYIKKHEHTT